MIRELVLARRARRQGARHVLAILTEARRAGIGPSLALALVQRESDFRNVFGSDPVEPPQLRAAPVTRASYRRYRELRDTHGTQGVGLTQLTWRPFQDDADAAGGAWKPRVQLRVGFAALAENIRNHGRRAGIAAYNGRGPRAERYALEVLELARNWEPILAGDAPAPGLPTFAKAVTGGAPRAPASDAVHPSELTVSVVVAAYDEEEHIGRLLDSLASQTHAPYEVIVADDGSRDRTAEIAERSGARVIRLPHRGPAVARNEAARHATGDVLVFVDGDMSCAPEFVERLIEPIAGGRAVGTYSRDLYLGNPDNRWARAYAAVRNSPTDRLLPDLPERWANFRAVRRDAFLAAGGYDDVGYGEDMTLAAKLDELALVAPGAVCFHYQPGRAREVFENGRWVGRGTAIRELARPWRAHAPHRVVGIALRQIRQGRTPWVLPARLAYHTGVYIGLAQSTFRPEVHWK